MPGPSRLVPGQLHARMEDSLASSPLSHLLSGIIPAMEPFQTHSSSKLQVGLDSWTEALK